MTSSSCRLTGFSGQGWTMLPLRTEETSDFTAASSLGGVLSRFHATVPFHTRLEPL